MRSKLLKATGKRRVVCMGCGKACRISHQYHGKLEEVRCSKCRSVRESEEAR